MRRLAGFAIGVAVLVGASPASAGTLSVEGDTVVYEAAPGEDNTIETSSLTIRDSTATMQRGPGCKPGPPEESARYNDPHGLICDGLNYGNVARLIVRTGDGNDEVWENGFALIGVVDTGEGNDRVRVGTGVVRGGDGDDTISKSGGGVDGGAGNDHISGASWTSHAPIEGGPGADTIEVLAATAPGRVTPPVNGGDGDDAITVNLETARLRGELDVNGAAGNDAIRVAEFPSGAYEDAPTPAGHLGRVAGGDGNDGVVIRTYLHPEPAVDGGPGDDFIDGVGSNGFEGGEGNDHLALGPASGSGPRHKPKATGCAPAIDYSLAVTLFARADGGPGADVITGTTAAELIGGDGNDRIEAGAGTDDLRGGPGDDTLIGGGSASPPAGAAPPFGDRLDGGAGADVIRGAGAAASDFVCYSDRGRGVTVDLGNPGGDGEPGEGDDVSGVSYIVGSNHDDFLIAGAEPLRVSGLAGDDALVGGPAADGLNGGRGDDRVDGGPGDDRIGAVLGDEPGADVLRGGAGDDTINGGTGIDRVEGGDGGDTLRGGSADDWVSGGAGEDVLIADDAGSVFNHSPIISLAHDDQLWCGGSTDVVRADYADGIGSDCELAVEGTPKWRKVRVGSTSRLTVRARCAWVVRKPCVGTLRIMAARALPALPSNAAGALRSRPADPPAACRPLGRRTLARKRFDMRAGRVGLIQPKLAASARKLLSRRGCIPVVAQLEFQGEGGVRYGSSRTLLLVARGYKVSSR